MDQKTDAAMPTATIDDRVGEYLYPDEERAMMMFKNPDGKHFALKFDVKILVVLNKMCGVLLHQWHRARPDKGVFFREAGEATVSAFNELRGVVAVQFDGDIAHVIPTETALELAELLIRTVEKQETPEERRERLAKKHPTISVPRRRIITP